LPDGYRAINVHGEKFYNNNLHMEGVGVKLKRDAKILEVWHREKGPFTLKYIRA